MPIVREEIQKAEVCLMTCARKGDVDTAKKLLPLPELDVNKLIARDRPDQLTTYVSAAAHEGHTEFIRVAHKIREKDLNIDTVTDISFNLLCLPWSSFTGESRELLHVAASRLQPGAS